MTTATTSTEESEETRYALHAAYTWAQGLKWPWQVHVKLARSTICIHQQQQHQTAEKIHAHQKGERQVKNTTGALTEITSS